MTNKDFSKKNDFKYFSYAENMKIRSERFRDQPEKPIERAVWWTEYILRNPNPLHLQSPVRKVGFLRSNLFDVVFTAGVLTCLIIMLISQITLKCCRSAKLINKKFE